MNGFRFSYPRGEWRMMMWFFSCLREWVCSLCLLPLRSSHHVVFDVRRVVDTMSWFYVDFNRMCAQAFFCFDSIDSLGIRCALGDCWLLPTFSVLGFDGGKSPMSMVMLAMECLQRSSEIWQLDLRSMVLFGCFRFVFCVSLFYWVWCADKISLKLPWNALIHFNVVVICFTFRNFHWILNCRRVGFKDPNRSQRGRRKPKLGLVVNSTVDPEWINWNQLMQRTFIVSMLALGDAFFPSHQQRTQSSSSSPLVSICVREFQISLLP